MSQKFLPEDIDNNSKEFQTITNGGVIHLELSTGTINNYHIRSIKDQEYRLTVGFYYYKYENSLNETDGIDNTEYLPEETKYYHNNCTFIRVSGYKIISKILEDRQCLTIDCPPGTRLMEIDIHQLYPIEHYDSD